jgi:hypothetical protein
MPTAICLTSPRPLDDCSVVGHILIEDLDYPELKCGSSKTNDFEKYSSQLSEYRCHIQRGTETLRNKVMVNEHFYIQHSPPILYVKKTIFTHGDASYDVPIVCRSTKHPLHIFSITLNVNIKGKQLKRYLETFNTGRHTRKARVIYLRLGYSKEPGSLWSREPPDFRSNSNCRFFAT